jgi:hypothetical protein
MYTKHIWRMLAAAGFAGCGRAAHEVPPGGESVEGNWEAMGGAMKRRRTWFALSVALCGLAAACSGSNESGKSQGSEGGPCYQNCSGSSGLSCFGNLCVNDGPDGSSSSGTGSGSSSGSSGVGTGYVCVYTMDSSYACPDSNGKNPPSDVCADQYSSLDDCEAHIKNASKSSSGCYYVKNVYNYRWLPGTCTSGNYTSGGGSSGSSGGTSSSGTVAGGDGGGSGSSGSSGAVGGDAGGSGSGSGGVPEAGSPGGDGAGSGCAGSTSFNCAFNCGQAGVVMCACPNKCCCSGTSVTCTPTGC